MTTELSQPIRVGPKAPWMGDDNRFGVPVIGDTRGWGGGYFVGDGGSGSAGFGGGGGYGDGGGGFDGGSGGGFDGGGGGDGGVGTSRGQPSARRATVDSPGDRRRVGPPGDGGLAGRT